MSDRRNSRNNPFLPRGWITKESKTYPGRIYYFNTNTKSSQWTLPSEESLEIHNKSRNQRSHIPQPPDFRRMQTQVRGSNHIPLIGQFSQNNGPIRHSGFRTSLSQKNSTNYILPVHNHRIPIYQPQHPNPPNQYPIFNIFQPPPQIHPRMSQRVYGKNLNQGQTNQMYPLQPQRETVQPQTQVDNRMNYNSLEGIYNRHMNTKVEVNNDDNYGNSEIMINLPNLFVFHLAQSINQNELKGIFERFGKVLSTKVIKDTTGLSKGFGFVLFERMGDAIRAIKEMDGKRVNNKYLKVSFAKDRKDKQ